MIIECPECGTKNTTDKPPQPGRRYRCGKCGALLTFQQTADTQGIFTKVPPEKARPETKEEIKREQVPKKRKGGCLGCLGLIAVLIIIVLVVELSSSDDTTQQTPPTQTPAETQDTTENPQYIYEDGAIHVGGDGEPIELINNPSATNPSYAELVAFIKEDSTDKHRYATSADVYFGFAKTPYVCSDFAEDIHNNAEAAGIKAGWVSIDFWEDDEGHACNAFETTDRGLVYIDCTGGDLWSPLNIQIVKTGEGFSLTQNKPSTWDKVVYVEIGKEYGAINITNANSLLYSSYEEYKRKWQQYEKLMSDYNDEITRYNQEIRGKVYYEGSPELARIEAWEAKLEEKSQVLNQLAKELGDFWFEPLGIVEDIRIHW